MSDYDLIRRITDADVPLEIVGWDTWEHLRAHNPTWVSQGQLRSSEGLLVSEGFSRCQGVCFLDEGIVGALAHNRPEDRPGNLLTGKWSTYNPRIEDPKKVFEKTKNVKAVHIYHKYDCSWPESWIDNALEEIGITNVVHIPILPMKPGTYFWNHLAEDVKNSSVYIFPTDFKVGLKYCSNKN